MPATVAALIDRALEGLTALAATAQPVEDEWQYVADLENVWRSRLSALTEAHGSDPADDEVAAAIDAAVAEAMRIDDPHRAIDWLSTLPQVTLVALGEAP